MRDDSFTEEHCRQLQTASFPAEQRFCPVTNPDRDPRWSGLSGSPAAAPPACPSPRSPHAGDSLRAPERGRRLRPPGRGAAGPWPCPSRRLRCPASAPRPSGAPRPPPPAPGPPAGAYLPDPVQSVDEPLGLDPHGRCALPLRQLRHDTRPAPTRRRAVPPLRPGTRTRKGKEPPASAGSGRRGGAGARRSGGAGRRPEWRVTWRGWGGGGSPWPRPRDPPPGTHRRGHRGSPGARCRGRARPARRCPAQPLCRRRQPLPASPYPLSPPVPPPPRQPLPPVPAGATTVPGCATPPVPPPQAPP